MNVLLLGVILVSIPIVVTACSETIPKAYRRKQIRRYIRLYTIVLGETLKGKKEEEEYRDASLFFLYWSTWIVYAADAWINEKVNIKRSPQVIAWSCLDYALDGDLKKTLQIHSSYLNDMQQYDNSPKRIKTIMKCIEDLRYQTERGDAGLNSFKGAMQKYHIEQYRIDAIKRNL